MGTVLIGVAVVLFVVLLALPIIAFVVSIVVMVAGLLLMAGAIGITGAMMPAALLTALKMEEEHQMLGRVQSYWRDSGEVVQAQALLGGWCMAQCGDKSGSAVGGLLSSVCSCVQSPRAMPKLEAEQRALAWRFIRWARQQRSAELQQLGRLAQEVLEAYDAGDQARFDRAESRFWYHWITLPQEDWDAVIEWRESHVPERLRRVVFRELLEETASELEQLLKSAP